MISSARGRVRCEEGQVTWQCFVGEIIVYHPRIVHSVGYIAIDVHGG